MTHRSLEHDFPAPVVPTGRSTVAGDSGRGLEVVPSPTGKWVELSEQISACGRMLRSSIAQYSGPAQVSEAEFSLLWACGAAPPGGLSQKELADALVVSPAHVSGLVEQLRRKGLLRGRRAANDRRRRQWQITARGRGELHHVLVRLSDWAARLNRHTGDLPDRLLPLVDRLTATIDKCGGKEPDGKGNHEDREVASAESAQKRGAA